MKIVNSEDARRLREQKEVAIVEHRRAYLAERQIRVSSFSLVDSKIFSNFCKVDKKLIRP